MKMRKLGLAFVTALAMTCFVAIPAFATEPEVETPGGEVEEVIPSIIPAEITMQESLNVNILNQRFQMEVTVNEDATDAAINWSSSDPAVVEVDEDGYYIAKSEGTATITATAADGLGGEAICEVTVGDLYTGAFQVEDGDWYYLENGVIADTVTEVKKLTVNDETAWYYVKNGRVMLEANTIASNANGDFYIKNGKVDFNYTGIAEDDNGDWWRIVHGSVDYNCNSVEKNEYGWWYIKDGKVDFTYTGIAKNANGWWRIVEGKLDWNCNSVERNEHGWFYIKNGKVDFSYTGIAKNAYGWWRIVNGKVDFNCNSVEKNENGWFYIKGGKVDFSYTGIAKNANGWWRIVNGKVDFNCNSVEKNEHGWFYIKNGKVDFTFTGVAKNANGWFYIKNGKVDFTYTGVVPDANGVWYVRNGYLDFNYNGTISWNNVNFKVTNGQLLVPAVNAAMCNKANATSSATNWLILVDLNSCRVGIFYGSKGNWTCVKYIPCSPGASSTPTVKGTFTVGNRGKSFGTSSYTCWYYTQFYGNYLFHSVLYQAGSMTKIKDGRLGMHLSHGCVRLNINEAKWIYDNIPTKTKVITY